MELTPPFVELYYNRGDLRAVRGDAEGALADFSYVLDLDPGYVDAYLNRAALRLELGDVEGAALDVAAGLALDPAQPHLRCQHARMEWERGEGAAARATLDALLADAPELAEAWALRAAVRFDDTDLTGALADISRALELEDSAVARYNRGAVHEALQHWADAAEDYTRAIALDRDDPDAWLRRADCRGRVGETEQARSDLRQFVALAPERAAEATAVLPDWENQDRERAAAI
jgi:tetratricopeptide (TPR) repeat protein